MACLDSTLLKRLKHLAQAVRLAGRVAGAESREAPRAVSPWGTFRFAPVTPWANRPEWTGHQDYSPGDDFRCVDWRICARHDELLTRRPDSVPDGRMYVFVDCSPSMSLGQPAKLDVARQIAAAIGYVALDRLDQVAVSAFDERIAADSGPFRGRSQIGALLRFLERLAPRPGGTNLARAAADWVRRRVRPGPVAVVGDLYDPENLHRGLGIFCEHGCRPYLVQVYDPAEASPPMLGEVELCDVETGDRWTATVTARHQARYRRLFAEYCGSIRTFCNRHRIGYVAIPTDMPHDEVLLCAIGVKAPEAGKSPR